MSEEYVDILDNQGNPTDESKLRDDVHRDGDWHQTVHIWLYTSDGQVLIQKRALKGAYPGLWDISVAGHIDAGEAPDQTVVRELQEELGIKLDMVDIKKVAVQTESIRFPERSYENNEFINIYLWCFDGDLAQFTLQEEEVAEVNLIPLDQLITDTQGSVKYQTYVPHKPEYYQTVVDLIRNELEAN